MALVHLPHKFLSPLLRTRVWTLKRATYLLRVGHAPVETLGNGWCCVFALSESLRLQSPIELCDQMIALLLAREMGNAHEPKEPGSHLGHFFI